MAQNCVECWCCDVKEKERKDNVLYLKGRPPSGMSDRLVFLIGDHVSEQSEELCSSTADFAYTRTTTFTRGEHEEVGTSHTTIGIH